MKKKTNSIIRGIIQLAFFLFLPGAFTAAFGGIKYLFSAIGASSNLGFTALVAALIVLCAYTVIFGRFFCGYACAFGALGDWVNAGFKWLCRKLNKKPPRLSPQVARKLDKIKFVVLGAICVACFLGVYDRAKGYSPWDVFSMLHARNLDGLAGYGLGIALLVLIIAGMCLQERCFCRFLCPMGAIFSLLPVLPFFSLSRRRAECIKGCSLCTRNCPAGIELPDIKRHDMTGECYQCGKCIDFCPKKNIQTGIGKLKGNEIWFTLVKAGILAGLFIWLGI